MSSGTFESLPRIARPLVARHGGGGGHGGGGHGHSGHYGGIIGSGGPGYPGPDRGWKGADPKAILACLASLALFIFWMALAAAHEYAALVVSAVVIFGAPLAGLALLALAVLVARLLRGH
jgi:hypothetical protein